MQQDKQYMQGAKMSLLGNALIGAIGGGAQSYADQIRLEAQQAREDRLKLKERSIRESEMQSCSRIKRKTH